MAQVKIGPEYFAKELREYSLWQWAFVREAFQNCIDAPGSSQIKFDAVEKEGKTYITWSNDGKPMDLFTIENKLFALGGTGKEFEGTIGGFGKAKTLLYFAHDFYEIKTGSLMIRGRGGDYDVHQDSGFNGTQSTVVVNGYHARNLIEQAKRFVDFAQWSGSIEIQGESFRPSLKKGAFRKELGLGSVYTNKSFKRCLVVRIGGIPMFTKDINFDRCVVVELSGSSQSRLTSNRDGLSWRFSAELDNFVTRLAVDRRSALDSNESKREVFGDCLSYNVSADDLRKALSGIPEGSNDQDGPEGASDSESSFSGSEEASARQRFTIYNKTGYKIPEHFVPGKMGAYSRKLSQIWLNIIREMYCLADVSGSFSTGFVFDFNPDYPVLASYDTHDGVNTYYINPALPNFKKRFALTDRDTLIAYAAHEFVHGAYGLKYHDEDFAARLTVFLGIVMKNRKRFNKCFAVV
jgi:hypothetical protein